MKHQKIQNIMYCLFEINGKIVKTIAVSKSFVKLIYKLRETATDFVTPRYDGEVLEDMLDEISNARTYFEDENEGCSYCLIIEKAEEI